MIRESRRAAVIFEPDQGWVPVDTDGTIWRYRTRGSSGVVVFKREGEGDGARSYEATHLDRFSNDQTITTPSRRKAVRFATTGTIQKTVSAGGYLEKKGDAVQPGSGGHAGAQEGISAPAKEGGGHEADLGRSARSGEGPEGVAGVHGQLYAADAAVVELRRGEYWVDVPGASGPKAVTVDPSRATSVAQLDPALLRETLAAIPTARVIKIRVTVTEVRDPEPAARRDGMHGEP